MYVRSNMDFQLQYANPKASSLAENETLIDPFKTLLTVDYGDAAIIGLSLERSMAEIRRVAYEIAKAGAVAGARGAEVPEVSGGLLSAFVAAVG